MSRNDPVRKMLKDRGAAKHVVDGGVEDLLKRWAKTVKQVEAGYTLTRDDYLNDMDTRQLLHEALDVASASQQKALAAELKALDARFIAVTRAVKQCIWGDTNATREWSAKVNWWYFRLPLKPANLA